MTPSGEQYCPPPCGGNRDGSSANLLRMLSSLGSAKGMVRKSSHSHDLAVPFANRSRSAATSALDRRLSVSRHLSALATPAAATTMASANKPYMMFLTRNLYDASKATAIPAVQPPLGTSDTFRSNPSQRVQRSFDSSCRHGYRAPDPLFGIASHPTFRDIRISSIGLTVLRWPPRRHLA